MAQLVAREVAEGIVIARLAPTVGARTLWQLARQVPDIEPQLRVFIGLASEWDDDVFNRPAYESDIVAAADRLAFWYGIRLSHYDLAYGGSSAGALRRDAEEWQHSIDRAGQLPYGFRTVTLMNVYAAVRPALPGRWCSNAADRTPRSSTASPVALPFVGGRQGRPVVGRAVLSRTAVVVLSAAALAACSASGRPSGAQAVVSRSRPPASPISAGSEPPSAAASGALSPSPGSATAPTSTAGGLRVQQRQTAALRHSGVTHLSLDGRWLGYLAGLPADPGRSTQAWLYDLRTHRDERVADTSYPGGEVAWIEVGRAQVLWLDIDRTPSDADRSVRWRIYTAPLDDPVRSRRIAESTTPQEFPPLPRLHGDTAVWAQQDAGGTSRLVVATRAGNWRPRPLPGEVRPDSVDVLDDGHVVVGSGDGQGHVNVTVVNVATGRRRVLTKDGNSNFPRGRGDLVAWEGIDGDYSNRTVRLVRLPVAGSVVTLAKGTRGNVVVGGSWAAYLTADGLGVSTADGRSAVDLPVPRLSVAARLAASGTELAYADDPSPQQTDVQTDVHVLTVDPS